MHHGGTEITEELFPDRLLKRGANEISHELKLTDYQFPSEILLPRRKGSLFYPD